MKMVTTSSARLLYSKVRHELIHPDLLKVYLKLGWVKLNTYYSGLTAMAYAGALVMNPLKKTAALRIL
jgi:hypothetical protein